MVERAGTDGMNEESFAERGYANIVMVMSLEEYQALCTVLGSSDIRAGQWFAGMEGKLEDAFDELYEAEPEECGNMHDLLSLANGMVRKVTTRFEDISNRMNDERGSAYRKFE